MPDIQLDEDKPLTVEELTRQLKLVKTIFRRMESDRCPYCDEKWKNDWCYVGGRESYFLACPKCKTVRSDKVYIEALKKAVDVK